jgi:hypothetical protein
MGARVTPPGRLPSSVASEAFLRAADRQELERDRVELYVLAAVVDELGPEAGYGPQAVYWLRGPWGARERVLSLGLNGFRRRQVASLRDALRRSERVGPFRLARQTAESGRRAWALVPAGAEDEQLPLDDGSDS